VAQLLGTSLGDKVQAVLRVTLLAAVTVLQFVLGGKLATGYAQGDLTILFASSTDECLCVHARNSGMHACFMMNANNLVV
jgi:hypothetical protein